PGFPRYVRHGTIRLPPLEGSPAAALDFSSGRWNHRKRSAAFPTGSADGKSQAGARALRISFEEVPLDVRRAAAQRLESIRGTGLGRGADAARLGREVCPIHRPDLDEVAYYEFELVVGAGTLQLLTPEAVSSRIFDKKGKAAEPGRPGRSAGHGFIIVS